MDTNRPDVNILAMMPGAVGGPASEDPADETPGTGGNQLGMLEVGSHAVPTDRVERDLPAPGDLPLTALKVLAGRSLVSTPDAKLVEAIKASGHVDALAVAWETPGVENHTVIHGYGRWSAADYLAHATVPVVYVRLDSLAEAQELAYALNSQRERTKGETALAAYDLDRIVAVRTEECRAHGYRHRHAYGGRDLMGIVPMRSGTKRDIIGGFLRIDPGKTVALATEIGSAAHKERPEAPHEAGIIQALNQKGATYIGVARQYSLRPSKATKAPAPVAGAGADEGPDGTEVTVPALPAPKDAEAARRGFRSSLDSARRASEFMQTHPGPVAGAEAAELRTVSGDVLAVVKTLVDWAIDPVQQLAPDDVDDLQTTYRALEKLYRKVFGPGEVLEAGHARYDVAGSEGTHGAERVELLTTTTDTTALEDPVPPVVDPPVPAQPTYEEAALDLVHAELRREAGRLFEDLQSTDQPRMLLADLLETSLAAISVVPVADVAAQLRARKYPQVAAAIERTPPSGTISLVIVGRTGAFTRIERAAYNARLRAAKAAGTVFTPEDLAERRRAADARRKDNGLCLLREMDSGHLASLAGGDTAAVPEGRDALLRPVTFPTNSPPRKPRPARAR